MSTYIMFECDKKNSPVDASYKQLAMEIAMVARSFGTGKWGIREEKRLEEKRRQVASGVGVKEERSGWKRREDAGDWIYLASR